MTEAKAYLRLAKKLSRKAANKLAKQSKAEARKRALVITGQALVIAENVAKQMEKPVDTFYDQVFNPEPQAMPVINKLAWLNGKLTKNSFGGRKVRSGHLPEYNAAIGDHGAWTFAKQVDLALNPPPVVE